MSTKMSGLQEQARARQPCCLQALPRALQVQRCPGCKGVQVLPIDSGKDQTLNQLRDSALPEDLCELVLASLASSLSSDELASQVSCSVKTNTIHSSPVST